MLVHRLAVPRAQTALPPDRLPPPMPSTRDKLEALIEAARERELTPVSWWIGARHHDEALADLADAHDLDVAVEAERLTEIEGLEVKVLTESPDRFALWCEEGVLDL